MNIYFYEGETEEKLIKALKKENCIPQGKLQKFNFWHKEAARIVRKISQGSVLYIIFDTDRVEATACQQFLKNIRQLVSEKKVKEINLWAQHGNLEKELCYACLKRDRSQLFRDFYDTTDEGTFKASLIKESNLFKKLSNNNFDIKRLWSREDIYLSDLSGIDIDSHKLKVGVR